MTKQSLGYVYFLTFMWGSGNRDKTYSYTLFVLINLSRTQLCSQVMQQQPTSNVHIINACKTQARGTSIPVRLCISVCVYVNNLAYGKRDIFPSWKQFYKYTLITVHQLLLWPVLACWPSATDLLITELGQRRGTAARRHTDRRVTHKQTPATRGMTTYWQLTCFICSTSVDYDAYFACLILKHVCSAIIYLNELKEWKIVLSVQDDRYYLCHGRISGHCWPRNDQL